MVRCRYGAALALGVACAGTGLKEAVSLLETLTNDPVSYVRQGALIASALVLVQQNDQTCSRVAHFRQLYAKVTTLRSDAVVSFNQKQCFGREKQTNNAYQISGSKRLD